jgi:hypothetical protein
MLPDDMPAPGDRHYPTLCGAQRLSELGDSQKQQIDDHRASRIKKNPVWIKNTMIQENYLQRDTQPLATKNRKITKIAKELNLWERLDGICQGQATQGKCRFWDSCKAWHLDWGTSADKSIRQLIFI